MEIKLDEKADYTKKGLSYNVSTKKWFLDGKNTIQDRTMRQNLKDLGVEGLVKSRNAWGASGSILDFLRKKQKTKRLHWGDKEYD